MRRRLQPLPWMPLILIIDKRKDDVTLGAAALQKQNSCTEPNYQRTLMQKDVVIQELKKTERLGFAGGDHYIIDLTMGVSSSAHIEYHVRVILEKFILRCLINVSANVIDSSYKESTVVFELLD